jgi:cytidylate kinase
MIIAIDGPAASGKGTLAKRIAAHYDLPHLDTGLLYRAVARALVEASLPPDDEHAAIGAAKALSLDALDPEKLRGAEMSEAASRVAAIPAVRAAILALQRGFARQPQGAVLDGRDIGTVVCPDADVKLFVTASLEERAKRRWRELVLSGAPLDYDAVLDDIRRRDARDTQRSISPLRQAADAALIDTTHLDAEGALAAALAVIGAKTKLMA